MVKDGPHAWVLATSWTSVHHETMYVKECL